VDRLRVAIVGGGIGGLAAANALSQRGIDVRVYEQAEQLAEVGAGVGVAPNGVRMLRRLGLGEAVEGRGSRWTDSQYCRSRSVRKHGCAPCSRQRASAMWR
jgi:2-polyprenyl-6-methoxyphenol hydroxylase-like FAD-dependent oxidoreductase